MPLEDPTSKQKAESTRDTILKTLGAYLGVSQQPPRPIPSSVSSSTHRYLETLELAPGLKKLLGDGRLVDHLASDDDNRSLVHTASDYSYSADRYAGNGWRIIGDAGGQSWELAYRCFADLTAILAFIDPFFSSGIHLAFTGALSAAVSISASIRGDCGEDEAASWHTERVTTSFTRFVKRSFLVKM